MSLSDGSRAIVVADGNFDIMSIIDQMEQVESQHREVSCFFVTPEQYEDMMKMSMMDITYDGVRNTRLFGKRVEICDSPPWCVAVVEEF